MGQFPLSGRSHVRNNDDQPGVQWSIVVEFEKIGSVIYKLLFSLQGCREGIFFLGGSGARGLLQSSLSAWDRLYLATSEYDWSGEWNLYSR